VRVGARLRAHNLKSGANPLDGARLQYLFLNEKGETLMPIPAPLDVKTNSDWANRQNISAIPPGATIIKIMLALARTTGTLDVDDIYIEPADAP
jgi:hypothetical protein